MQGGLSEAGPTICGIRSAISIHARLPRLRCAPSGATCYARFTARPWKTYSTACYRTSPGDARALRLQRPEMLRDRAAVADKYGDNLQAKSWRETAAMAARFARNRSGPLILGQRSAAQVRLLVWCKSYKHRSKPDIAVSSRGDGQSILQALRSGAKEFLTAPVVLEELLLALQRLRQGRASSSAGKR